MYKQNTGAVIAPARNIIVAEDMWSVRYKIVARLYANDRRVMGVKNGQEALDRMRSLTGSGERIDVLVTDVGMPIMDGDQLLEDLITDPSLRRAHGLPPVVVYTRDRLSPKIEAWYIEEGGKVVVLKKRLTPDSYDEVAAAVDDILRN